VILGSLDQRGSKRGLFSRVKARGHHAFRAWIIYQTIKGLITMATIWGPLILLYFAG